MARSRMLCMLSALLAAVVLLPSCQAGIPGDQFWPLESGMCLVHRWGFHKTTPNEVIGKPISQWPVEHPFFDRTNQWTDYKWCTPTSTEPIWAQANTFPHMSSNGVSLAKLPPAKYPLRDWTASQWFSFNTTREKYQSISQGEQTGSVFEKYFRPKNCYTVLGGPGVDDAGCTEYKSVDPTIQWESVCVPVDFITLWYNYHTTVWGSSDPGITRYQYPGQLRKRIFSYVLDVEIDPTDPNPEGYNSITPGYRDPSLLDRKHTRSLYYATHFGRPTEVPGTPSDGYAQGSVTTTGLKSTNFGIAAGINEDTDTEVNTNKCSTFLEPGTNVDCQYFDDAEKEMKFRYMWDPKFTTDSFILGPISWTPEKDTQNKWCIRINLNKTANDGWEHGIDFFSGFDGSGKAVFRNIPLGELASSNNDVASYEVCGGLCEEVCASKTECGSCTAAGSSLSAGCGWDHNTNTCVESNTTGVNLATNPNQCDMSCDMETRCDTCTLRPGCSWCYSFGSCVPALEDGQPFTGCPYFELDFQKGGDPSCQTCGGTLGLNITKMDDEDYYQKTLNDIVLTWNSKYSFQSYRDNNSPGPFFEKSFKFLAESRDVVQRCPGPGCTQGYPGPFIGQFGAFNGCPGPGCGPGNPGPLIDQFGVLDPNLRPFSGLGAVTPLVDPVLATCNGRGLCRAGPANTGEKSCTCQPGYYGESCEGMCPGGPNRPCSGSGRCLNDGTCICDCGWGGYDCSIRLACDCSGNQCTHDRSSGYYDTSQDSGPKRRPQGMCESGIGKRHLLDCSEGFNQHGEGFPPPSPPGPDSTCSVCGARTQLGSGSGSGSGNSCTGFFNENNQCECMYGAYGDTCENFCPGLLSQLPIIRPASDDTKQAFDYFAIESYHKFIKIEGVEFLTAEDAVCGGREAGVCNSNGQCDCKECYEKDESGICVPKPCLGGCFGGSCSCGQCECPNAFAFVPGKGCAACLCENGGTCSAYGICQCEDGFAGPLCTLDIRVDINAPCNGNGVFNSFGDSCVCDAGWYGPPDAMCTVLCDAKTDCNNAGYCDSLGACHCHVGFAGDNCGECAEGWIQDNGCCVPDQTHSDATCMDGDGSGYGGAIRHTWDGFTCQDWDASVPNSNPFIASASVSGSVCRNPNEESGTWCYALPGPMEDKPLNPYYQADSKCTIAQCPSAERLCPMYNASAPYNGNSLFRRRLASIAEDIARTPEAVTARIRPSSSRGFAVSDAESSRASRHLLEHKGSDLGSMCNASYTWNGPVGGKDAMSSWFNGLDDNVKALSDGIQKNGWWGVGFMSALMCAPTITTTDFDAHGDLDHHHEGGLNTERLKWFDSEIEYLKQQFEDDRRSPFIRSALPCAKDTANATKVEEDWLIDEEFEVYGDIYSHATPGDDTPTMTRPTLYDTRALIFPNLNKTTYPFEVYPDGARCSYDVTNEAGPCHPKFYAGCALPPGAVFLGVDPTAQELVDHKIKWNSDISVTSIDTSDEEGDFVTLRIFIAAPDPIDAILVTTDSAQGSNVIIRDQGVDYYQMGCMQTSNDPSRGVLASEVSSEQFHLKTKQVYYLVVKDANGKNTCAGSYGLQVQKVGHFEKDDFWDTLYTNGRSVLEDRKHDTLWVAPGDTVEVQVAANSDKLGGVGSVPFGRLTSLSPSSVTEFCNEANWNITSAGTLIPGVTFECKSFAERRGVCETPPCPTVNEYRVTAKFVVSSELAPSVNCDLHDRCKVEISLKYIGSTDCEGCQGLDTASRDYSVLIDNVAPKVGTAFLWNVARSAVARSRAPPYGTQSLEEDLIHADLPPLAYAKSACAADGLGQARELYETKFVSLKGLKDGTDTLAFSFMNASEPIVYDTSNALAERNYRCDELRNFSGGSSFHHHCNSPDHLGAVKPVAPIEGPISIMVEDTWVPIYRGEDFQVYIEHLVESFSVTTGTQQLLKHRSFQGYYAPSSNNEGWCFDQDSLWSNHWVWQGGSERDLMIANDNFGLGKSSYVGMGKDSKHSKYNCQYDAYDAPYLGCRADAENPAAYALLSYVESQFLDKIDEDGWYNEKGYKYYNYYTVQVSDLVPDILPPYWASAYNSHLGYPISNNFYPFDYIDYKKPVIHNNAVLFHKDAREDLSEGIISNVVSDIYADKLAMQNKGIFPTGAVMNELVRFGVSTRNDPNSDEPYSCHLGVESCATSDDGPWIEYFWGARPHAGHDGYKYKSLGGDARNYKSNYRSAPWGVNGECEIGGASGGEDVSEGGDGGGVPSKIYFPTQMGIRWLDNEQQCVDPFEKNANTPQRTASWLYWSNFVGEHRATVPFDWDQTDRIVRAFDVLGDPACQTDDGGDRRTGALSYSLCSASPVLGDTAFLKYPGKFNKFGKEVIADQRHNIFNYLGIQNGAIRVKFTFKDHVGNVGSTEANFDGDFRDSNPGVEARGRLQSAWVTQPVQVDSQGPTLTKVGLVGPYNTGASPTQAVEESLLKGVNDVSDVNLIAAIGDVITLSYELSKEASRPTSVAINGEKIDDDAVFRPVDADPTMAACVSRTCVSEYSGREFTTFNVSLLSTKWAVDKTVKLTDYPTGMRAFVAHNNCQARRHGGGALWNPLWAEYCLFGLPPVTWYLAGVQDRARLGLYESTEKSAVPSVCGEAGAGLACEPGEDATLVSCKGTELQTQPLVSDSLTLASPVALSRSRYADEPKPNYTVPSIVDMCVQSSNKYPHLAKVGDRIRVSVWADQPIYKPNMTIAGIVVPLSDITANSTNSFTVDHINGETCVKSILAQKNYKKIDLEGDDPRQACYGDIDACMALAVETCEDMETDATGTSVKCMGFHIRRVLKEETIDGKRRSLLSARAQCDRAMTARHLLQVEWVESESSSSPDLCNDFSLITYFRRKSEQETTVFDSCTGMFVERTYANVHWTGTVTIDDPTSQVDGLVQISVNYRNVNDTWGVLVTEDDIDELGAACMPSDCPRCQVEEEVSCPVTGVWLDTTPPVITSIDTRMRWLCDSRFNGGTEYLEIHRRKISAADYILDPGFDDKYVVDGIGSGSDVYYTTPTMFNISDSYQMLFHQLSSMRSLDYPDLVYTGQEHLYINVSVSEPVQNLEESVSFANRPIASFSDSRAGDRGYWAYGTHEWTRNNQYGPSPDGEDPSVWGGFVFFIDTLIKEYYNFTTSTVIGGENGDIDIPFDVAGLTDLAGNVAVTRTQSEVEIFDRKRFSFDVEGPMLAERIDGKPNSECSMAPTGRDTCSDHCFYWQNMDDHTSWLGVIEDDVRAPPIDIGQGQSTKSVCYTDNKLGKGKAIPGDTMTCEFTFTEEVIIESFSPHGAYHFYGTDCDETECRYFVGSPLSDVNIVGYGGKVPEKGDYTFTSGNGQTYSHSGTSFDEMTETHDTFSKSWTVTMKVPEDLPEGRLRFAVTVFDKSCKTLLHGNGLIVSDNEDDYDNVVYFKKTPPAVTKLCDLKTDHTKKVRIAKPDTVVSFTWSTSNDLMEDWEKHSKTRNLRDISLSRGDVIVDDYSSSAGLTSTADASPFAGTDTDMLPEVNAYLCDVKLSAELVSTRRVGNSSDPPEVIDPEDSRGWHYETIVNLTASETDSTSDGLGKSCVGFGALMFEFKFMDIFGVDNREKVDKRAHQTQDCAGSEEKLFESVFFSNVPPALDAVNDAYDAMPAKVCSNSSFAVDLPPYTFFHDMDREIIVPQWEERVILHDETYSPEICQPVGVREAGPGDYVSVFFDFNEFETLPVKITAATIGGNSVPRAGFGNYNTYNPLGQPQCQNALNIAGVPTFNDTTGFPLSYGKRKYASAYNQTYWGGDSCDNADLRNVDEVRPGEPVCTALVNAYGPGPCDKTCSSPKSPCSDYYREWSITTTLGLPLSSGPIPWTVDVEDYLGQTARFNGETTTVIYVEPSEESCAGRCGLLSESGACSCAAGCRDLGNCCADAPTCCKDYVGSSLEAQDQDGGCLIPDDRPPQAVVKTWSDNKFWGPSVAIAGDRVFTALFGDEPIAPPQFSFGLADYLVKIPASAVRAFSPAASKQMALSWGKVLRAEEERMKAYDPDAEEAETRAHTKAFKLAVSSYSQIQKSLINENCKLFSVRYNKETKGCTLSNSQYRTKRFTGMNSTLPVSSFREVPRTDFYWAAFKTPSQYTDNGLMPFEVQFQEESQNQLFARYGTPGLPINDESVLDSYVEIVPEASLLEGAYVSTSAVTPTLHELGVTMYSSRTTELPMPSVVYVNPPVIETCEWSQETNNCCRLPDDCGYECWDGKVGFGDVVYLQHITNQGVFYPSVQISGVTLTGTPLSQDKLTFSNYSSPAPPIEWIIRTDPLLTGNGPAWKGGLVVGAGSLPLSYEWVHGLIINEKHSHKSGPVPFTASMRDEVGNSVAFGASKPGEVSELDCSTDRPVLDLDPPSFIQCEANNPTGDGFDLTFALCEPGWVNYTVVECGLAGGFSGTGSNSNDEGTSGGDGIGNSNVTGFVEIPLGSSIGDVKAIVTTLRYLKDSTQYCVWVDACDIHSNCIRRELAITGDGDGRAPDLNEETLDETAPSFNVQPACYPEDRYGFSMDIGFATNEPGKVYWMITNSCVDVGEFNNLGNILGSDIKAGVLPSGYPGDIIGSGVVIIPNATTPDPLRKLLQQTESTTLGRGNLTIDGLEDDTSYCVFFALEDDASPPNLNKGSLYIPCTTRMVRPPNITFASVTSSHRDYITNATNTTRDQLYIKINSDTPITTPYVGLKLPDGRCWSPDGKFGFNFPRWMKDMFERDNPDDDTPKRRRNLLDHEGVKCDAVDANNKTGAIVLPYYFDDGPVSQILTSNREDPTTPEVCTANSLRPGCKLAKFQLPGTTVMPVQGSNNTEFLAVFSNWVGLINEGQVEFCIYNYMDFGPFGEEQCCYDYSGNRGGNAGELVTTIRGDGATNTFVDKTPPELDASLYTNNTVSILRAGIGNLLTMVLTADEPIFQPVVVVEGTTVPLDKGVEGVRGADGTNNPQHQWIVTFIIRDTPAAINRRLTWAVGALDDLYNGPTLLADCDMDSSEWVYIDTVRPSLAYLYIQSDNGCNGDVAKPGDTVALTMVATEPIFTPVVKIAGIAVEPYDISNGFVSHERRPENNIDLAPGMRWTANITLYEGMMEEGFVRFEVSNITDSFAANKAVAAFRRAVGPVSIVRRWSRVYFDSSVPKISYSVTTNNPSGDKIAHPGDTVTVKVRASEYITNPVVTVGDMIAQYPGGNFDFYMPGTYPKLLLPPWLWYAYTQIARYDPDLDLDVGLDVLIDEGTVSKRKLLQVVQLWDGASGQTGYYYSLATKQSKISVIDPYDLPSFARFFHPAARMGRMTYESGETRDYSLPGPTAIARQCNDYPFNNTRLGLEFGIPEMGLSSFMPMSRYFEYNFTLSKGDSEDGILDINAGYFRDRAGNWGENHTGSGNCEDFFPHCDEVASKTERFQDRLTFDEDLLVRIQDASEFYGGKDAWGLGFVSAYCNGAQVVDGFVSAGECEAAPQYSAYDPVAAQLEFFNMGVFDPTQDAPLEVAWSFRTPYGFSIEFKDGPVAVAEQYYEFKADLFDNEISIIETDATAYLYASFFELNSWLDFYNDRLGVCTQYNEHSCMGTCASVGAGFEAFCDEGPIQYEEERANLTSCTVVRDQNDARVIHPKRVKRNERVVVTLEFTEPVTAPNFAVATNFIEGAVMTPAAASFTLPDFMSSFEYCDAATNSADNLNAIANNKKPIVANGICDPSLNVYPCYDGGDCCEHTCIISECNSPDSVKSREDGATCLDISYNAFSGERENSVWDDVFYNWQVSKEYSTRCAELF
mmetsp:Transcript_6698/g.23283  ORF Transcript_6698/g.23283 Transcript_6698/m.23283 type:complete len:5773 (-) Transcript_6698:150-17468(-)